jgi:LppX_LprAFG lipoprotein
MNRSLLALAVVASLVAAGCGGADEEAAVEDNPLAALDTAAQRTTEVESMRQQIAMDSDLGGEKLSMDAEGSFTADSQTGTMKAKMETGGEEIEFEAIMVDGTMYMKGDAFPIPDGKEWVKTPDSPTSTMEPAEFVKFLRESEGVENVGTEEIRGDETTHYRGPVDLERLARESDADVFEQIKQSPEALEFDMVIDVWVLEDGLPARIAMELTAPGKTSGGMTMTADVLEYDVPVDAEAPPADKVAEGFG